MENNGHIDCFYVAYDFINKCVGSKLLCEIEERAKLLNISRLFTEASVTAKPFFLKKGFEVVKRQIVELRGVKFKNYVMEKGYLNPS